MGRRHEPPPPAVDVPAKLGELPLPIFDLA